MMIKATTKLYDTSASDVISKGKYAIIKHVDVRDLLVRMYSEDPNTRDSAKKTLLNLIRQTDFSVIIPDK